MIPLGCKCREVCLQGVALARQLASAYGTPALDILAIIQAVWQSAPAVHPACRALLTQPVHFLVAGQCSVARQDAASFIAAVIPLGKKGVLAFCKGGLLVARLGAICQRSSSSIALRATMVSFHPTFG